VGTLDMVTYFFIDFIYNLEDDCYIYHYRMFKKMIFPVFLPQR